MVSALRHFHCKNVENGIILRKKTSSQKQLSEYGNEIFLKSHNRFKSIGISASKSFDKNRVPIRIVDGEINNNNMYKSRVKRSHRLELYTRQPNKYEINTSCLLVSPNKNVDRVIYNN